ncbi:hypothetical protein FSARC_5487 [Fusarium sarcochroum]|uniref:Zn(2)-C6 fungal-type domain-containing protein n=1 Tax=Fusarium sarcochroum TaxID=1208366 RepID=A0A8H4XAC6_9HYPO|nr:hypothetical protein FSARC_5487 [Fusarium sarcochroum]
MTSQTTTSTTELRKYACTICARRKVKCDKRHPCSNCRKTQVQCSFETPLPPKPRKRAADEDLLARLAQYEELMQKHNIDYTQHANIWVSSGMEAKSEPDASTAGNSPAPMEICSWSRLSPDLKYPPMKALRHKEDPFLFPSPPFHTMLFDTESKTHELHPEPKQIYLLWQTFVEAVNPLLKITHVPSLQKRILDAIWDPINIPKPLSALIFAIYTLSVTSMSSDKCQTSLGQDRAVLLTRYRSATVRALAEADFLTSKNLETLQALVLFIFADPESQLASTLVVTAVRLGHMMGLHRTNSDTRLSFFEKEMRTRLWWQLKGLESRICAVSHPCLKPSIFELGETRPPLNVNDADLHPDMLEPPIEHTGPTEMACVLMKFEVTLWLRSSVKAVKLFENIGPGSDQGKPSTKGEDDALTELQAIYQEKYLSKFDRRVPFYNLTHAMANLALARFRFKIHHPRRRAAAGNGDVYMTHEESDILFDAALSFLELTDVGHKSKFSFHILTHLTTKYQIDAYIYVISDLRHRYTGPRIDLAWKLVDGLYSSHPEIIEDAENPLFVALGNLTLEAWEARRKILTQGEVTPSFIHTLWSKRRAANAEVEVPVNDVDALDGLDLTLGDDFDWNCWSDFLRL